MGSPLQTTARFGRSCSIDSDMASIPHWPSLSLTSRLFFLTVFLLFSSMPTSCSPTSSCLRSCHHCKQMYGHHFSGHLCARSCLRHKGGSRPVCTDLGSIQSFLDLSSSTTMTGPGGTVSEGEYWSEFVGGGNMAN